jgi:hypothetical protein
LFIGIKGNITRTVPYIANRQAKAEFPSAGFIAFALIHALFDQMQLCRTHGAFQPQ